VAISFSEDEIGEGDRFWEVKGKAAISLEVEGKSCDHF
jgi:hypothetical protein